MKFILEIAMPDKKPYTFEEIKRSISGSLDSYLEQFPDAEPKVGYKIGIYEPGLPDVPMMEQRLLQIGHWKITEGHSE